MTAIAVPELGSVWMRDELPHTRYEVLGHREPVARSAIGPDIRCQRVHDSQLVWLPLRAFRPSGHLKPFTPGEVQ